MIDANLFVSSEIFKVAEELPKDKVNGDVAQVVRYLGLDVYHHRFLVPIQRPNTL